MKNRIDLITAKEYLTDILSNRLWRFYYITGHELNSKECDKIADMLTDDLFMQLINEIKEYEK